MNGPRRLICSPGVGAFGCDEKTTSLSSPGCSTNRSSTAPTPWQPRIAAPRSSSSCTRPERPGGVRFGQLVHAVLATVPLDAPEADIAAVVDVQARLLSAPPEEAAASRDTVLRVLGHDLLHRARQAATRGMCRREAPVTRTLGDGALVEGIVDLAFEEKGSWTVIDYKTDREIAAGGEDRYRRQLALYVEAIGEATGARATGVLVRI